MLLINRSRTATAAGILENSTLNVLTLTRSPLARQDFDPFKQFGTRLLGRAPEQMTVKVLFV